MLLTRFNPRTRMGCDVYRFLLKNVINTFQSTHPHGVRPTMATNSIDITLFQSTHPHGVRHLILHGVFDMSHVSIHAPAWGATLLDAETNTMDGVFQSTHPHGVRPFLTQRPTPWTACFNPRTRMGCDFGPGTK